MATAVRAWPGHAWPGHAWPVHAWPGPLPRWCDEVLVISVAGNGNGEGEHEDKGAARRRARARVRIAVREALSLSLAIDIERITLHSTPGSAPWLEIAGWPLAPGVSISHAGAISMAAINPNGAVGIDLVPVLATSDWARVAHDYLGMACAIRLAAHSELDRPRAFAQAWAEREACLKLRGAPLAEWTPLPGCRLVALAVPAGLAGALAL